jgi:hypothetical protein
MNGPGNSIKQWPGQPYPLGATWDGKGVRFARDTADPEAETIKRKGGEQYEVKGRSMVILRSKLPQLGKLLT